MFGQIFRTGVIQDVDVRVGREHTGVIGTSVHNGNGVLVVGSMNFLGDIILAYTEKDISSRYLKLSPIINQQ